MKKYSSILLPITTLILGLIGGWFASKHFSNCLIEGYMKTKACVDLSGNCRVLMALRSSETNQAIDILEREMNGDILTFGWFVRDMPVNARRPEDLKLLSAVNEYRIAHPQKAANYPEIDKGVADVLALANTNRS